MITPVVNGESIEQFIPVDLRSMFYHHAEPKYKYAIQNGLDPYGFSTRGLVAYIPLWALKESSFKSVDAYKHTCTVTGALWRPNGRSFDGLNDKLDFGNPTVLTNFTALTRLLWLKVVGFTGSARGILDGSYAAGTFGDMIITEGASDNFSIFVKNTGASVVSNVIAYTADKWLQIGYSWDGTNITYYKNGAVSGTVDALNGTLACSARALLLGDEGTRDNFGGEMGEFLIYNRALAAEEISYNYNSTVWRYQ